MAHAAQIESLDALKLNAALTPVGVIPRDVGKSPERFGRNVVPAAQLRGRLGPTTWRVWLHATEVRGGNTGAYFEKRSTCASELGISERQVKESFARLTAAGLSRVVSKSWTFVNGQRHHWKTTREVLGHFGSSSTGTVVMVPAATALWVRCGKVRKYAKHGTDSTVRNPTPPAASTVRNPDSTGHREQPTSSVTSVVSSDEETRCAARALSLPKAKQHAPTTLAMDEGNPPAVDVKTVAPSGTVTALGTRLGGGGAPPRLPPGLPPYPDSKLITAVVPKPPQVPANASLRDLAFLLLKAYRGAVESRTKARCFVHAKGFEKSKDFKTLVVVGQRLRELEMPPAAWASWSIGAWMDMGAQGMPSLGWVFAMKRIEEHHGWFLHELGECGVYGGRVIFSAPAHELYDRYQKMLDALHRERAETPEAVRAVVARYLPESTYHSLYERAKALAAEDTELMAKRVRDGGWVWS